MAVIDYYENSESHGNYQYVALKQIIDDFIYETIDDDSVLKNTRRTKIIKHAKDALRELNKTTFNQSKAIEITVPENLSVVLPHDYVSFKRLSVVVEDSGTDSFRLLPLNRNSNINVATGWLQDSDAELLFDSDGFILTADASNGYNKPYKVYEFYKGGDNKQVAKYGEYTIDESRGTILFSSDMYDKEIVLEYRTDGLQFDTYGEDEIKVHKDMIEVLRDRIFYTLIRWKQNVPQNRINAALNRYKTTKHQAKVNRLDLNIVELLRNSRNANF